MATALVRCRLLQTPCGRDTGLMRFVAAIPNMDGRTQFGKPCPLFVGKYFITESSDVPADATPADAAGYFRTFKQRLEFLGYDRMKFVS